jgi:hypothetical protein
VGTVGKEYHHGESISEQELADSRNNQQHTAKPDVDRRRGNTAAARALPAHEGDGERDDTNGEAEDTDWGRVSKAPAEVAGDVCLGGDEEALVELWGQSDLLGELIAELLFRIEV